MTAMIALCEQSKKTPVIIHEHGKMKDWGKIYSEKTEKNKSQKNPVKKHADFLQSKFLHSNFKKQCCKFTLNSYFVRIKFIWLAGRQNFNKNLTFAANLEKRDGIGGAENYTTRWIVENCKSWGLESIEARTKWLIAQITELYRLPRPVLSQKIKDKYGDHS